jgi:restriction system protein
MNEEDLKKKVAELLGVYSPRIEALKQRRAKLMDELRTLRAELIEELHELRNEAVQLVSSLDKDIEALTVDVPKKAKRKRKRVPRGALVSQGEYRLPILEALIEMGGRGRTSDVLTRVEEKMRVKLNKVDYERTASGDPRWRNRAAWVRNELVEEGYLKKDSPRGIWEITDAGRALYQELKVGQQT